MSSDWERHWNKNGAAKPQKAGTLGLFRNFLRDFTRPRRGQVNRFLFRGVADSNYDLKPSLLRAAKLMTISGADLYKIEQAALDDFKNRAHLYVRPELLPPMNDRNADVRLRWFQMMQHHGAKTRLLDWTVSPYVALYFAVSAHPDKDGSVWMVENGAHSDRMRQIYPVEWKHGFPLYYEPQQASRLSMSLCFVPCSQPDERMAAQKGWFSCGSLVDIDHGEAIAKAFKRNRFRAGYFCRKVTIPSSAKPQMLRELWQMNITGESLYPGIDGLGKAAAELPILLGNSQKEVIKYQRGQLTIREVS